MESNKLLQIESDLIPESFIFTIRMTFQNSTINNKKISKND